MSVLFCDFDPHLSFGGLGKTALRGSFLSNFIHTVSRNKSFCFVAKIQG